MSKRPFDQELELNAQKAKRLKTGLTLSEDAKSGRRRPTRDWSTLPDVLLSKICKKAFGDSCRSHATFAMVCPIFHSIAKQPSSWSGKFDTLQLFNFNGPQMTLYRSDSHMKLDLAVEPLKQIFSGSHRSKALLVEELDVWIEREHKHKEQIQMLLSTCNYSILQKCKFSAYSFIPNALVQAIQTRSSPLLQDMSIYYDYSTRDAQLIQAILAPSLKKLRLQTRVGFNYSSEQVLLSQSIQLPRLQELEFLGNFELFGSATQDLIYLPHCPQLRKIKFHGTIGWDEGKGKILFDSLLHLETIEYLYERVNMKESITDIIMFSRVPTFLLKSNKTYIPFSEGILSDSFMKALFQNSRLTCLHLINVRLPADCRAFRQETPSLTELNLVAFVNEVQQIAFPSTLLKLTLDSLDDIRLNSFSSIFFKALETCPALTCLRTSGLVFKSDELLVLKHLKELFLGHVEYPDDPIRVQLPESIVFLGVMGNLDPLRALIHQRKNSPQGLSKLYVSQAYPHSLFQVLTTLAFPVQHLEIQNLYHHSQFLGMSLSSESLYWRNIHSITWEQDSVETFQQIYYVLLSLPSQLKELYLCNRDTETNKDTQGTRFSVYDGLMRCKANHLQVLHVYDNESSFESSHKDLYPSKNFLEKIQKMQKRRFPQLHDVIWKRFLVKQEKRRDSILPTYFHKQDVP